MERYLPLADKFSQNSLHAVAYSALPNAPVQPCVEQHHRIRRLMAPLRHAFRGPAITLRPACFSTEC